MNTMSIQALSITHPDMTFDVVRMLTCNQQTNLVLAHVLKDINGNMLVVSGTTWFSCDAILADLYCLMNLYSR